ncbi:MAG: PQQ-binding-like beta-propeller repeat protein [Phycisphaerales bacterium]|nr:PQQ-binding-like beta-propeller repeat protein [Phycisphaerales bacterium]
MKQQTKINGVVVLVLALVAASGVSQVAVRKVAPAVAPATPAEAVPADTAKPEAAEKPEEETIEAPPLVIGKLTLKFVEPGQGVQTLLPVEYDCLDTLRKIPKLLGDERYTDVLKMLQLLLEKPDSGFIQLEVNGKAIYRPLSVVIMDILRNLPDEPRAIYIQAYEPKAAKLLADAKRDGDITLLSEVADIYQMTESGKASLKLLAAWMFDRGQFAQAALRWKQCGVSSDPTQEALRLARITVAMHMAGNATKSQETLKTLVAQFPTQTAEIAGQTKPVVPWVKTILAKPILLTNYTNELKGCYPGISGIKSGWGVCMGAGDIVPLPMWSVPEIKKTSDNCSLMISDPVHIPNLSRTRGSSPNKLQIQLVDGEVCIGVKTGTSMTRKKSSPQFCYGEPVMVSGRVIVRTDRAVEAYDSLTGSKVWETLYPARRSGRSRQLYYLRAGADIGRGHYRLAVFGDHVYALGDASSESISGPRSPTQGTSLTAFSISGEGKTAWRIGNGNGPNSFLRTSKLVSLPSGREISAGIWRLYLVVRQGDSYCLACIEDHGGRVEFKWKTEVASHPRSDSDRHFYDSKDPGLSISSPPLVADGRVYICTNSGVVASVKESTGKMAWAVQYPSTFMKMMKYSNYRGPYRPNEQFAVGNPLIATDDGIVVQPADGKGVYCFSPADGQERWFTPFPTDSGLFLTGLSSRRVASYSPKSLEVIDTQTGKILYQNTDITLTPGRGVNTDSGLLISAPGGICRVASKVSSEGKEVFSAQVMPLLDTNSRVGSLAANDGQLVAFNVNGLSLFSGYSRAYEGLSNSITAQSGRVKWETLYRRGMLCFGTDRLDEANRDFSMILAEAGKTKASAPGVTPRMRDSVMAGLASERLREVFIRQGNLAKAPNDMLVSFTKAQTFCQSDSQSLHMRQRLVECYALMGQYDKALDLAEAIASKYKSKVILDDLRVGIDANDYVLSEQSGIEKTGKIWLQTLVARFVRTHGPKVYSSRDALARQTIDAAILAKDIPSLRTVPTRWPVSKWVPDAKFALAGLLFDGLQTAQRVDRDLVNEIVALLDDCTLSKDQDRVASALAGLYALSIYQGDSAEQEFYRREIDANLKASKRQPVVAFSSLVGTLKAVRDELASGKLNALEITGRSLPYLSSPLGNQYQLPRNYVMVLSSDQQSGLNLFSNRQIALAIDTKDNRRLVFINRRARDEKSLVVRRSPAGAGSFPFQSVSQPFPMGQLSADGKRVMLYAPGGVVIYDFQTAECLYSKTTSAILGTRSARCMEATSTYLYMTKGPKVLALDFDGKIAWQADMTDLKSKASNIERVSVSSDSLLVSHGNQYMTALDLRTGKRRGKMLGNTSGLLRRPTSNSSIVTFTAPNGNWARMRGIKLELGTKTDPLKVTSTNSLSIAKNRIVSGITGISDKYVAVIPDLNSNKIWIYTTAGKKVRVITLPEGTWPNRVSFDGEKAYLHCSLERVLRGRSSLVTRQYFRGLTLIQYNIESGSVDWSKKLITDNREYFHQTAFVICRNNLLISMNTLPQSTGTIVPGQCFIVNRSDGQVGQSFPLLAKDFRPQSPADHGRMLQTGTVSVQSGRVLINSPAGAIEYGRTR